MTIKEKAERIFNQLDEEQLNCFITLFGDFSPEGNARKKSISDSLEELFSQDVKEEREEITEK